MESFLALSNTLLGHLSTLGAHREAVDGYDADTLLGQGGARLQQALQQNALADNLTCLWQKGVRHRITPEALAATVDFFQRHL